APGLHQNPALIAELLQSQPDPLESQFRATYSTLLNLLDAYQSFAHVREIAERSFAHRDVARRVARLEKEILGSARTMKRKLKEDSIEQAFDEVRTKANELAIEEPKLKDVRSEEDDAVEIINNMIDRIAPGHINEKDKQRCAEALWSVIADAEAVEKGAVRIEALRNEVWRPFELRARVLDHFG